MNGWRTAVPATVLAWLLLSLPPPVVAVDNAAIGGIGGLDNGTLVGGDGTGEARLSLFAEELALVKQARDLTGTVLPDGTDVAPGQEIWFVLYVDNFTDAPADDVTFTDSLAESDFTYLPGSLEQTVVASGSDDEAIWAATWTSLTDAVGAPDDGASAMDTGEPPGLDRITLGADPEQTNQTVDVPALSLRALRFRVRVN